MQFTGGKASEPPAGKKRHYCSWTIRLQECVRPHLCLTGLSSAVACCSEHDEDLREPLVRRQGSQVSMRVARGSAHGHHPLAQPAHPPPPSPTHVPGTQQVLRSAGPEVGTPDSVFLVLRGGQALSCSSWQLSTWQWPWHTVSAHYLGREGMCSVC